MPSDPTPLTRAEFEEFLHFFTHELRNQLNAIALEAADLAEQTNGQADGLRLQANVRDCAAFLKQTREILVPDDPAEPRPGLAAAMERLRAAASAGKK
jgi:signal transduction histidine kinase